MKAIVVYESHWGNTAAVARAIAEGIGPDAHVLSTDEATAAAIGRRRSDRGGLAAAGLQPAHGEHAQGHGDQRSQGSHAA